MTRLFLLSLLGFLFTPHAMALAPDPVEVGEDSSTEAQTPEVPVPTKKKKKKKDNAAPTPTELYEEGLQFIRRGYFTKALENFQRVRNYHRDDPVSILAQLAIADVHFRRSDFEQARYAYEEFGAYHPRHASMDYVSFRIGFSVYKRAPKAAGRDQTPTRSAVNAWAGYEVRYPDSEHVEEVQALRSTARERLAKKELQIARFYADRSSWEAVRGRCEGLISRYSDTPAFQPCLALLGKSLHARGNTDQADQVRAQLAQVAPQSDWLRSLDRALESPPGTPREEEPFFRPYRLRGLTPGPGGV